MSSPITTEEGICSSQASKVHTVYFLVPLGSSGFIWSKKVREKYAVCTFHAPFKVLKWLQIHARIPLTFSSKRLNIVFEHRILVDAAP
jgi:hypothetical protein